MLQMLNDMNNSKQPSASFGVSSRGMVLVIVESCILLALDLAAFVGNTLVCVAVYRKTSLRTVTNNFILSLALTDLLMAVLVMPLITSASVADEWIGGTVGLVIEGHCFYTLAGTSVMTVMLLAINRYFRVVRPTLYRTIYSKKSSAVMAVTAWILSTLLFSAGFSASGVEFRPNPSNPTYIIPMFSSKGAFTFYVTVNMLSTGVACPIIVACYVKIYQTIHHHNTAAAPSSQQGHSSFGVEEAKITRMMTVILIGFYLCWLPPYTTVILESLTSIGDKKIHNYKNFYFLFPIFASSVINPLIYATMSRPFRMEFLKILRCGM